MVNFFSKTKNRSKTTIKQDSVIRFYPRIRKVSKNNKKYQNRKIKNGLFLILKVILIIASILIFIYLMLSGVNRLRGESVREPYILEQFPDLKIIPDLEYSYDDKISLLYETLEEKNIYLFRKSSDISFDKSLEAQKKLLEEDSWTFVRFVSPDSVEMMEGYYFFKGEIGLRIYIKEPDIVFQIITKDEAVTSLSVTAEKRASLKEIIKSTRETTFLPNYAWNATFPSEYTIFYYKIDGLDIQSASIKTATDSRTVDIIPIKDYIGGSLATYAEEYRKSNELSYTAANKSFIIENTEVRTETVSLDDGKVYFYHYIVNPFDNFVYLIKQPSGFGDDIISKLRFAKAESIIH